ncbi:MAG: hypothetical protein O2955_02085 [Planctomycetota bacterium]|nr:hypothetical protein [Planctomycetota bacterium]MDA1211272.1 hypothetical protein [Planctomycetota bacterium]
MRMVSGIRNLSLLAILLGSCLAGCGPGTDKPATVAVGGVVTLDGQPVKNARVRFIPDADKGRAAAGTTGDDGSFSLSTFDTDDGIVPGNYSVDVTSMAIDDISTETKDSGEPLTSEIPAKFSNSTTSGVSFTIGEGDAGKNLEIKLTTQ